MGRLFVNRPVFAAVISIIVVIAGLVASRVLPISRYPDIAPPTVQVTAVYPGADARTAAEMVAAPIEQQINGIEGMLYISSVSGSDGVVSITVTFEVGTDLDLAQVLVQNRVSGAEPGLPEPVKRQGVSVKKKSSEITSLIGLTSDEPAYDDLFLSNFATLRLRDELLRVPGVGDVVVFGAGEYGMRIWIDPERLRSYRLTVSDVTNAVREQNVEVAAGRIGSAPAVEGQTVEYGVGVRGRLADPEAFGEIIVKAGDDGRLVRLRDVARVELGAQTYAQTSRFSGRPAAVIAVYQLPGANAIRVADGVARRMQTLAESFPSGVEHTIAYESTRVIRASIREVLVTLAVAMVLVVLTVYVFLQSLRATLIPAVTIPVALIGTLAVMLAFGFSINMLTLFGLVLAIGVVVDDSIVVVENVTRHLDEGGLSPKEAAIRTMGEVAGPVVATTLVLLAVFVPTVFLPGIAGRLFQQFALTISIATVFSSVNALTLSPALAGILLRPTPASPVAPFRLFNALLGKATGVYAVVVRGTIRVAPLSVTAFVVLIVFAVWLLGRVPGGFVPQEDEGWCIANIQLPDGATLGRTSEVVDRFERRALETPGVAETVSISGMSIVDGGNSPNAGTVFIIFDDWGERESDTLSQRAIVGQLNAALAGEMEAAGFAFPVPSLPGMGSSAGLAGQIEDREGRGLEALRRAVDAYVGSGFAQPGLRAVLTTFRTGSPGLFVDIDREAAMRRGVRLQDVFDALGAALGSAYVNDFPVGSRSFQVRVQADAPYRSTREDIGRLEVRNSGGDMVPVSALASIREDAAPAIVTRYNVYPSAKVMLAPAPGTSTGEALALGERVAAEALPEGFGFEWTELAFQASSGGGAAAVLLLAVLLVYLVLAAQYESWTLPISVVVAVPTAILGAAAALLVLGLSNDLYTQIGVVLLVGLSAKSSILIVEFARSRRNEGADAAQAAREAASLRFRAILMTAFSFILGVLPLLVASGAGAVSRRTIGATVFGGMLVGTVVGVVFVPVLYFAVQRASERLARLSARSS